MSMSECGRRLKWAGGEHDFDLGAPRALSIITAEPGRTPYAFMARGYFGPRSVFSGQFGDTVAACLKRFDHSVYSIGDIERVLELGLYGGGMPADEAFRLVDTHVRGKPLAANAVIAYEVLATLFVGAPKPKGDANVGA